MTAKTIVVIPAWNEEKHIEQIVKKTKKIITHVLVVDDGSKDNTGALAKKAGARVLVQQQNSGKGAAARAGCDDASKNKYANIILMDADGQHKPKDIPRFLRKLQTNDIVFGYREQSKDAPWLLTLGNWGLTQISHLLFGINIKDTQCGYRAFTREAYEQIRWENNHYGMESEMIYRAKGLKYTQIPIKRIYLDKTKGAGLLDGFFKIFPLMIQLKIKGKRRT